MSVPFSFLRENVRPQILGEANAQYLEKSMTMYLVLMSFLMLR